MSAIHNMTFEQTQDLFDEIVDIKRAVHHGWASFETETAPPLLIPLAAKLTLSKALRIKRLWKEYNGDESDANAVRFWQSIPLNDILR
jgi:hypothetical protein